MCNYHCQMDLNKILDEHPLSETDHEARKDEDTSKAKLAKILSRVNNKKDSVVDALIATCLEKNIVLKPDDKNAFKFYVDMTKETLCKDVLVINVQEFNQKQINMEMRGHTI